MKKFYALAIAAVAGLSIASAQQAQKAMVLTPEQVTMMPKSEIVSIERKMDAPMQVIAKAPAKAPAATATQFEGTVCTFWLDRNTEDLDPAWMGTTSTEAYGDDMLIMQDVAPGFFGSAATAYEVPFNFVEDTEHNRTLAVIPTGGTIADEPISIYMYKGTTYYLYFGAWVPELGTFACWEDEDIEFIVKDGAILSPVYTLTTQAGDQYEGYNTYVISEKADRDVQSAYLYVGPSYYVPNATFNAKEVGEGNSVTEVAYPLFAEPGETDAKVIVYGIGDYSEPVEFEIDYTTNVATATDQVITYMSADNWVTEHPFYFTTYTSEMVAEAKYSVESGKSVFTFESGVATYGSIPGVNNDKAFVYDMWDEGSKINFDFNIKEASGIEAVEVEAAQTDAPAVYYNLQGMQIANPVAGQMYIVKQGNQVSKIIR